MLTRLLESAFDCLWMTAIVILSIIATCVMGG